MGVTVKGKHQTKHTDGIYYYRLATIILEWGQPANLVLIRKLKLDSSRNYTLREPLR